MIKIIKRGTRKKTTCEECGCLFSYEAEDIKNENGGFCNNGIKATVICPQCNTPVILTATRDMMGEGYTGVK